MKHISLIALTAMAHSAVAQSLPVQVVNSCPPVTLAAPNTYTLQTFLYETTKDGQQEYLDLYTPIGAVNPHMAMVMHGGGFVSGDKASGNVVPLILGMVSLGWEVASINYRLLGANGFANLYPAPLQDEMCALQWLRNNTTADHTHMVVGGVSAGAVMANWVGTIAQQHNPILQVPGCHFHFHTTHAVAGIATFYGFFDFTNPALYNSLNDINYWDQTIFGFTIAQQPSALAAASPIDNISSTGPAYFISHGALDTTILPAQATAFATAAQSAGVAINLSLNQGVGHAYSPFDNTIPQDTCTLVAWLKVIASR